MMGKELIVGQVEPNFTARITIKRRFHGVMANNKHDEFEKNDYSTNNVLSNKGVMNIPFGSIFL